MTKLRITSRRLTIGHENERLLIAGDLDRAERDAIRHDVVAPRMCDLRPFEPIGHAVGQRALA